MIKSAPLSGPLLGLLHSFTWTPLSPESHFQIPAVAKAFYSPCACLSCLMMEGLSSHFSLEQPDITIIKFFYWFIQCRRACGPYCSSLDNGFLQVCKHSLMNSLKVTDGRMPDLTHYSRSKSIRVRATVKTRSLCTIFESYHQPHAESRMERVASLVINLYFKAALQRYLVRESMF